MKDAILALILDESFWPAPSFTLAFIAAATVYFRSRRSDLSAKARILAASNFFFGVLITTLAFGHLLAVSIKLAAGNLVGSVPLLYLIGIGLAVPSVWVILNTRKILAQGEYTRPTIISNALLAVVLLLAGLPNIPLALLGVLNIFYLTTTRPKLERALVGAQIILTTAMLVGALVFMTSRSNFEQFSGIDQSRTTMQP